MGEEKKTTAPVSSVGADGAQPNVKNYTEIIANSQEQINLQASETGLFHELSMSSTTFYNLVITSLISFLVSWLRKKA